MIPGTHPVVMLAQIALLLAMVPGQSQARNWSYWKASSRSTSKMANIPTSLSIACLFRRVIEVSTPLLLAGVPDAVFVRVELVRIGCLRAVVDTRSVDRQTGDEYEITRPRRQVIPDTDRENIFATVQEGDSDFGEIDEHPVVRHRAVA